MEAFFRGSHTTNFVTWGFNKSYNQAAEVPSSNVTRKSPCSPSITCRIMLAFVSMTHSITTFPAPFLTAIETLSLCTSMPIYLVLVIKGCSFLKGLSQALKTYSKRGALYIASRYRTSLTTPALSNRCWNELLRSLRRAFGFVRFLWPSVDDHGSLAIVRSVFQSDPYISSILNFRP